MRLALALALAVALAGPGAAQKRLIPAEPPPAFLADHEARLRLVLREAYDPPVVLRAVVRPSFQVEYAVGLRRGPAGFEIFAVRPSRQVWTYEAIALMKSGRMGSMRIEGLLDDPLMTTGDEEGGKAAARERKRDRRKGRRGAPTPDSATADALEDLADALEELPDQPTFRDTTAEEIARMEEGLPENPADLPLTRCAVAVDEAVAAELIRAWRRMLADVGPDPRGEGGADGTSYSFAMAAESRTLEGETWSPRPKTRPARLAALAETMREHCEAPEPGRLARIEKLARQLGGRSAGRP